MISLLSLCGCGADTSLEGQSADGHGTNSYQNLYPALSDEDICDPNDSMMVDGCMNEERPPVPSIRRPLLAVGPGEGPANNTVDSGNRPNIETNETPTDAASYPATFDERWFGSGQYPDRAPQGRYQSLPSGRSTNDGRLWIDEGHLWLFRPERLERLGTNRAMSQNNKKTMVPVTAQLDTLLMVGDGSGLAPQDYNNQDMPIPSYPHQAICDASNSDLGAASTQSKPRACTAKYNNTSPDVAGDCYDVSLFSFVEQKGKTKIEKTKFLGITLYETAVGVFEKVEIHTQELTIFVPNAKSTDAAVWNGDPSLHRDSRVLIYPRIKDANGNLIDQLPVWDGGGQKDTYKPSRIFHDLQQPPLEKWNDYTLQELSDRIDEHCGESDRAHWCDYLEGHHSTTVDFTIDFPGAGSNSGDALWSGYRCAGKEATRGNPEHCKFTDINMFEPSITGDGRLLVFNLDKLGVFYSYNSIGPCRADGWTTLRPWSQLPFDEDVNDIYPIAKALKDIDGNPIPFRDPSGWDIDPGQVFHAAYPWIDRKGRNLFFAAQNYKRNSVGSISHTSNIPDSYMRDISPADHMFPDGEPGKMYSMIGAWTQGKMIVLDDGTNFSDFGGTVFNGNYIAQRTWTLDLYDEVDIDVRPKSTRSFASNEHVFNQFDALKPKLPFDVVWTGGASGGVQVEIPFDDYMMNDVLVKLPMNASANYIHENKLGQSNNRPTEWDDKTEWTPIPHDSFGGNGEFTGENPRLQNAATSNPLMRSDAVSPPRHAELRGGARVEPVALGGVLGKGVYLDGFNDFIDVEMDPQEGHEWLISGWFDSRDLDSLRTLFFFSDRSNIQISRDEIRFYRPENSTTGFTQSFDISNLAFEEERFFHLAFKVGTRNLTGGAWRREVKTYVNGTRLHGVKASFSDYGMAFSNDIDQSRLGFSFEYPYPEDGKVHFLVGDPGPHHHHVGDPSPALPFQGWVDEIRVQRLDDHEFAVSQHLDEVICNHALGTLVKVEQTDFDQSHAKLGPLYERAFQYGHFQEVSSDSSGNGGTGSDADGLPLPDNSSVEVGISPSVPGIRASVDARKVVSNQNHSRSMSGGFIRQDPFTFICEQLDLRANEEANIDQNHFDEGAMLNPHQDHKLCINRVHQKNWPEDETLQSRCVRDNKLAPDGELNFHNDQPRPDATATKFCLECHSNESHLPALSVHALALDTATDKVDDIRRLPLDPPALNHGCRNEGFQSSPDGRCNHLNGPQVMDEELEAIGDAICPASIEGTCTE